ncbi:hypothetical protein BH24GEM2_BH24GEM2_13520 [soil metagenome]
MTELNGGSLLVRAQQELDALRTRARDLEGFIRVYRELAGSALSMPAAPEVQEPSPVRVAVPDSAPARPPVALSDPDLSIPEAAEKVLRHFGAHMKARQIAETMAQWGFPLKGRSIQDLRATVGGVLARKVREGETFTKPEAGVFGLAEWDDSTQVKAEPATQRERSAEAELPFKEGSDARALALQAAISSIERQRMAPGVDEDVPWE